MLDDHPHLVLVQLDDEALEGPGHEIADVGHDLVRVRGGEEGVAAARLAGGLPLLGGGLDEPADALAVHLPSSNGVGCWDA